jgi:hypothetical protein
LTHRFLVVIAFTLAHCALTVGAAPQDDGKVVEVRDAWGKIEKVHGFAEAHQPGSKWFIHDPMRPQPKAAKVGKSPTLGAKPPAGAVVLFDGTSADAWTGGPWTLVDGALEANKTGDISSKATFGDARVHVEFATPLPGEGDGQGRGNSGVFLMGLYEVQVLDSYMSATYPDGQCGAIYGQNPPLVNASLPPGEWQTYDIDFTAPRWKADGSLAAPARITVKQNGVVVQKDFAILGETGWRKPSAYTVKESKGPLKLQDHGNPTRYRNIWVVPR